MSQRIRDSVISYATTYISVAILFATSMLLARILTPEEVGVSSVSYAVIALANIFRDLGIANYIHTSKDLTKTTFQTCLGVSIAFGVFLFVLTITFANLATQLNYDKRVAQCLMILSINFLLIPPQATISAIFVRHGQQIKILISVVSAGIIYLISSWTLATAGASYLTTPIASVISSLLGVLIIHSIRHKEYPITPRLLNLRQVITISFHPFLNGLAKTGSERAPELSIAWNVVGYSQVAYYEKGATAVEFARRLTFDSVNQLFVPRFRKAISNTESLKSLCSEYISLAFTLGTPVTVMLWLCAPELISLLFGTNWVASANVLKILCIAIPALFAVYATGQSAYFLDLHSKFTNSILILRAIEIIFIVLIGYYKTEYVPWAVVTSEYSIAIFLIARFRKIFNFNWLTLRLIIVVITNLVCTALTFGFNYINQTANESPLYVILSNILLFIVIWAPITLVTLFKNEVKNIWSDLRIRPK